jgi:hypothetical protein
MTMRLALQYGTLFIVLFITIAIVCMVWMRDMKWRYAVLPLLLTLQVMAFYLWIFIAKPPPFGFSTDWSALLRFTEWLGFLMIVVIYWHNKRPFTATLSRKIKHVVSKIKTLMPDANR